jgi:hypothetical protein
MTTTLTPFLPGKVKVNLTEFDVNMAENLFVCYVKGSKKTDILVCILLSLWKKLVLFFSDYLQVGKLSHLIRSAVLV